MSLLFFDLSIHRPVFIRCMAHLLFKERGEVLWICAFTPKTEWRFYAEIGMAPFRRKFTITKPLVPAGIEPGPRPARVEPIFASGFSMRDVRCFFGASGALLEDFDCNPNTLYYTAGSELIVLLVSRSDSGLFREMTFPIFWNVVRSGSSNSIPTPNTIIDKNPPIAILEHDAEWKDYFFQNGENNHDCYAYTCSLNFTAEHSYDPE